MMMRQLSQNSKMESKYVLDYVKTVGVAFNRGKEATTRPAHPMEKDQIAALEIE
jgi:hypothetical protein